MCAIGTFLAGDDMRTALRVGLGLAQIGEFSFVIAALGVSLNVTSSFLYPIAVAVSAVTTLLNPYLIRNSDRFVGWFDQLAPPKLVNYLALYTQWVGQFGSGHHASMGRKLVRRWFGQMALNLVLVAAVFAGAAYVSRRPPGWLDPLRLGTDTIKAALWLGAMLLSLPLLIATFRKLQALGMLVAEMRVTFSRAGERTEAIRAVVTQSVVIAGAVLLSFFVLALSSTLLPSIEILVGLLSILALVTFLLWRSFVKIYSHAQIALRETLSQPLPPRPAPVPDQRPGPGLLRDADLATLVLPEQAAAAGKLIRELELRSRTGASIVGIERSTGERIINPGPDEELRVQDHVLLFGTPAQLVAAKALFLKKG
jgi:CPA2 family monovalent cation:H+ antiporter-2